MNKRIGCWQLGAVDVEVYATGEAGGSYWSAPLDRNGMPYLTVGLDHVRWGRCLEVLLHEAFECCLHLMDLSYIKQAQRTECSSNRWFMFNHAEFAEVCARLGPFIANAQVPLAEAYRAFEKERKATKPAAPRSKRKAAPTRRK